MVLRECLAEFGLVAHDVSADADLAAAPALLVAESVGRWVVEAGCVNGAWLTW
jgi:hypothetical protein